MNCSKKFLIKLDDKNQKGLDKIYKKELDD